MHFAAPLLLATALVQQATAQQGTSHQVLGPLDYYAQGVQPNYNYTNAMVQWLEVPLNTSIPEPTWDTDYGAQYGRQMPPPEFLQPMLDPALNEFRPKYGRLELNGTRIACGSEIMMDLCNRWSIGFRKHYNLVHFDCAPPFTGDLTGAGLVAGNISVGFVGRELKPIEVIDFHTKYGYTPACVPVSGGTWRHYAWLDAPAVMTHPSNPIQGLTFKQFDSIFSTTRHRGGPPITKWGQIPGFPQNHTLANQTIVIYGNAVWNGFEEFMRQKILNVYPSSNEQPLNNEPALGDYNIFPSSGSYKRGQWRSAYSNSSDFFPGGVPAERMNQTADPNVHWLRLVFDLAKAVSVAPNAIGYTGMAYIDSPVKILPLSVSDSGPFVGAGYTQVAQGHYPLSRVTYANVNKAPGKPLEPILSEFLAYIGSREGQQVVLDQAVYTPLQQWQVSSGQKRWQ